jgi:hypothetical protein
MCQLGDEVRKKEGKLDSTGLTSSRYIYDKGQYSNDNKDHLIML